MNEQVPSKEQMQEQLTNMLYCLHLVLDVNKDVPQSVRTSCGTFHIRNWLSGLRDRLQKFEEAFRASNEPPDEPSVMGGMLSQPRPPVPSGVDLIEWCVQQIQITCDALNLDPTQWLNDSAAQGDSAQPPPADPVEASALNSALEYADSLRYSDSANATAMKRLAMFARRFQGAAQPPAVARWRCVSYCKCTPGDKHGHFVRDDAAGVWVRFEDLQPSPTKGSAPPPMDTPVDGVPGVTIAEYMRAAVASAMCGKCKQPYCICVPTQGEEVR